MRKNIINDLRMKNDSRANELYWILKSYDEQSGSYIDGYHDTNLSDRYCKDGQRVSMKRGDFYKSYGYELSKVINELEYNSILEAGVGEATTFKTIVDNVPDNRIICSGFDISLSRVSYGQKFLSTDKNKLFVGDMFNIPFNDNSFDVVYTSHAIESNTDRSIEALKELYRVANKYLILLEPDYDLGNEATKTRMVENGYSLDIHKNIEKLGYDVLKYELFKYGAYNNQTSIIIIEKNNCQNNTTVYRCPFCKENDLVHTKENSLFCYNCSNLFPIVNNIPILLEEKAVLFGKINEFILC